MAEPSRPPHPPPGDAPDPLEVPRPPGFDQLGREPSWRERLDVAIAGATPGRLATAAAAAVAAVVIGAGVLRGSAPPPELTLPLAGGAGDPAATSTTSTTAPDPVDVVVHAAGAVARPGVYRLAAGARVADVLDAAGGADPDADLDRLNLAALLHDGDRVFVPVLGQEVPALLGAQHGGRPAGAATSEAEPIDLNTATLAELDTLPGVGPSTAQAILDERERRGGFSAVEDLLDVRGIGEAKLAAIRDLVRV